MSTTGENADGYGGDQPGLSNSAGVSSSSDDMQKCNECNEEEGPIGPCVVFCLQCKAPLCANCDTDVVHVSKTTRSHERMPVADYLNLVSSFGKLSPTEGQLEKDENNKFCWFSPFDHRIQLLPRLASLVKDPQAKPSLVSFIGPTGVGKSALIGFLLSLDGGSEHLPLVGAPNDMQSTSADIHMYASNQSSTVASAYPVLYMDSEGQGGSMQPRGTVRTENNIQKYMHGKTGSFADFEKKRFKHVQVSYPRMLYLFSDILCFVFSGNWRERGSIIKPLEVWGKTAAAGAKNQNLPQLIIIFNKTGFEGKGAEYDDFRRTSATWFNGDEHENFEKLKPYYAPDPLVVLIPQKDICANTVLKRVKLLREEIRESVTKNRKEREKKSQLFTRQQLQLYMQLAADTFSQDENKKFDIYEAIMARRPTSVGLAGYITEFRRAVAEEAIIAGWNKVEAYKLSLRILQRRIKASVRLWMGRLKVDVELLVGNPKLPEELCEALKEAQTHIDGEQPCVAISKGSSTCGKVRLMHGDEMHVSESTDFRWAGAFYVDDKMQEAADGCRLVHLAESTPRNKTTLGVKQIQQDLSTIRKAEVDQYKWLADFTCYRVCVACMIELPTEVLSCDHIICAMCAKEEAEVHSPEDFKCPVCLCSATWYPNDLPHLAGYRILSLDGGGVKGIVELLLLESILSFFPREMNVEDFFDVIVGTGTGGIIALALTLHKVNEQPKHLQEVIRLFEDFCTKVFSEKMRRPGAKYDIILLFYQTFGIYDTKYKSDNLMMLLEEHFGTRSLLQSCVGGPRVIITSCDPDSNHDARWFTSYNRLMPNPSGKVGGQVDGRVLDNHMFSAKDAAAATSAAGTYFPAYEAGSRSWVDGGVRYNCPVEVANQEARFLWPNCSASALISLGCGKLSKVPKTTKGIFSRVKGLISALTDAETQSKNAIEHLERLHPLLHGCFLRINPTSDTSCELDQAEKIPFLMKATKEYLDSKEGLVCVQQAANLLFAAFFYVHFEIDEVLQVAKLESLSIRSRGPLPSKLRNALIKASKSKAPPFTVTLTVNDRESQCEEATFNWEGEKGCTWENDVMNLPFNLNAPPLLGAPPSVVIKLTMVLPQTNKPKDWSLPISGMPCRLSAPPRRSNSRG